MKRPHAIALKSITRPSPAFVPFQSGDPNTNTAVLCAPISFLFAPNGKGMEGGVSIVSACTWEGGYPL